jgi:hypothetical protein
MALNVKCFDNVHQDEWVGLSDLSSKQCEE